MSKPHRSAQYGCPGKPLFACLEDNRLVKRPSIKMVVFTDKDSQQQIRLLRVHNPLHFPGRLNGSVADPQYARATHRLGKK